MSQAKLLTSLLTAATLAVLGACSSGGSGGGDAPLLPPATDTTGTWSITEEVTSATGVCAGEVGQVEKYNLQVTQSGNNLTVVDHRGITYTGTISGSTLRWTGSFPDDGGTTTINNLNITVSGDSLSGSTQWSWSDGANNCTGSTSVVGQRVTAAPLHALEGLWTGTEHPAGGFSPAGDVDFDFAVRGGELRVTRDGDPGERIAAVDEDGTVSFSSSQIDDRGAVRVVSYRLRFDLRASPPSFAGSAEWIRSHPDLEDAQRGSSELAGVASPR